MEVLAIIPARGGSKRIPRKNIKKLHGKPFTIVGNGRQTRDFTYVTDVIDAFLKAAESKIVNEIFNIGSGETVSINKIIKLLGGKKVFIKKDYQDSRNC